MSRKKPTMIDLFCGAGGLTLGFVRAGFRPLLAVEHEPDFADTYRANFGNHVIVGDVQDVIESGRLDGLKPDVVVGGPPCQGFSNLTQNRPDDPRRALWSYFMDVVEATNPRMFVMENVPTILSGDEGAAILDRALEAGYWTVQGVLLASDFGVPQNRRRAFIIGTRVGTLDLPQPNGERRTVRDAFAGIPDEPTVHNFRQNGPVPSSDLHIARNPTAKSLKRYRLIPPGGNRFDLERAAPELTPDCWKRKRSGGTDLFGRLEWDAPARCTVRTEFYKPEKGRYLHPEQDRPITHWEAARLQSFPDDFLWCGSKIRVAIQIGNAVPPRLAEAVARHVLAHLRRTRKKVAK